MHETKKNDTPSDVSRFVVLNCKILRLLQLFYNLFFDINFLIFNPSLNCEVRKWYTLMFLSCLVNQKLFDCR